MKNPENVTIELAPTDAMIILSILRIIHYDVRCYKLFIKAINNYNQEIFEKLTPEQIREANDELKMYALLKEAGL